MVNKGTKIYSIVHGKCPRCQKGDFFKYLFTIHPSKITKIHKNCSFCELKYMLEPSFFYGAMYVSYAITVAICIGAFIISKVLIELSLLTSFMTVFISLIVSAPINLRLSRILWIHMFVNYKP